MNIIYEKYNKWKEDIFESMDHSVWTKEPFTEAQIKETNKYFLNETAGDEKEEFSDQNLREENFKKRKLFSLSNPKDDLMEEKVNFSFSYPHLTMLSFEPDEFFRYESNFDIYSEYTTKKSEQILFGMEEQDPKKIPHVMDVFSSKELPHHQNENSTRYKHSKRIVNQRNSDNIKKKIRATSILQFFQIFSKQNQYLFSIANLYNSAHRIYEELFADMGKEFNEKFICAVDNILRLKDIDKAQMLYEHFEEKYQLSSKKYILQLKGGYLPKKFDPVTQKTFVFVPFIWFKKNGRKTSSGHMTPYKLYRNYVILEQENFAYSLQKYLNQDDSIPNLTNQYLLSDFLRRFKDSFICSFIINKYKAVQFFDHFLLPIPHPNSKEITPVQYLSIHQVFPWFIYRSHVMKKTSD